MRIGTGLVITALAASCWVGPASAQVTLTFANDVAREAAAKPEIAAVLALGNAAAAAIVRHDADAFAAAGGPELMVNSPANRVLSGERAVAAFKAGLIDYASVERSIEYATVRATGEVLLMGAERVMPRNATMNAGRTVTYRVTEIWRPDGGSWKLAVRQATIAEVR